MSSVVLGRHSRPASPRAAPPVACSKGPLDRDGSSSDETSSDGSSSDEEKTEVSGPDASEVLTPDDLAALVAEFSGSGEREDLAPLPNVLETSPDDLPGEGAPEDLVSLPIDSAVDGWRSVASPLARQQDGFSLEDAPPPARAAFDRAALADALMRQIRLNSQMAADLP